MGRKKVGKVFRNIVQRPCGRKTFDRRPRELEVRRGGEGDSPPEPRQEGRNCDFGLLGK